MTETHKESGVLKPALIDGEEFGAGADVLVAIRSRRSDGAWFVQLETAPESAVVVPQVNNLCSSFDAATRAAAGIVREIESRYAVTARVILRPGKRHRKMVEALKRQYMDAVTDEQAE